MPTLSHEAMCKAVTFLKTRARPIDLALYRHHFESGAVDPCDELAAFQNPDGGFGHALEPDLRLPDSSVIATTVALQVLREVGAPTSHPLVESACRYLLDTYDVTHNNWPVIPPNVDDAPHAPWWRYDPDLDKRPCNPRAEITGYMLDYPGYFPEDMRDRVVTAVTEHLIRHGDAEMEMHDLLCYLRFYDSNNLPTGDRDALQPVLAAIVEKTVECDPVAWSGYGLQPLAVINSPDSPFAKGFETLIGLNLDLLAETQSDDGAWYPNWSWASDWPDDWAQARLDWAGHRTVRNLRSLRSFGRLPA